MKPILKIMIILITVPLIAFIGFYFWASSAVYPVKEYSKLINSEINSTVLNDSVFSIITYNIGYLSGMTNNLPIAKTQSLFDDNLSKVKATFKQLDVDIITFQEIDYRSARSYDVNQQLEIAKLGYPYVAQAVNWDLRYLPFPEWPVSMHFGRIYSGQSVLSKYPIVSQERIVLDRVADASFFRDVFYIERLAQVIKIEVDQKTIVVINVHLEAFDRPTRTEQTKYIVNLYNSYKDDFPTLLVGDFNSDPKFKDASISAILNIPNIGNAVFTANNYPNTFDSAKPNKRLDYIFYNKNFIEEINSRVVNEMGKASDHLPVLMKFRLK